MKKAKTVITMTERTLGNYISNARCITIISDNGNKVSSTVCGPCNVILERDGKVFIYFTMVSPLTGRKVIITSKHDDKIVTDPESYNNAVNYLAKAVKGLEVK